MTELKGKVWASLQAYFKVLDLVSKLEEYPDSKWNPVPRSNLNNKINAAIDAATTKLVT